ncbi:MAG: DUF47 family protein [Actinomycetota bacterium]
MKEPRGSRLRRFARDLAGRSDIDFVAALGAQIDATLRGCAIARDLVERRVPAEEAHRRIADAEHDGDDARHRLIELLARSLATPIDREDLFRLSRSIDDVLDNLRDFIRELELYEVRPPVSVGTIIVAITEGMWMLRDAVDALASEPGAVTGSALAAKKRGNRVRIGYETAVVEVLTGSVTAEMLRRRELLRRLDVVGLRLGEAADSLSDASMKRSH